MWLDGFSDMQATIYTFPACLTTADLAGDGDFRLIVGDIGTGEIPSKLKIYRGTGLHSEVNLDDLPTAIAPMYIDNEKMPVITVASADYVYVYKNLRPFFRAVLPPLPLNTTEKDAWGQYTSIEELSEVLQNLKTENGISSLSLKSQHLLSLGAHERMAFVNTNKTMTLQRKNIITCMSTLKKARQEDTALTCLVLGTESKELLVLHPETFTPIDEAKLSLMEVPVSIATSGLFDIDYTLTTTLRNGHLVLGRRGWVSPLLNLGKPAIGVVCLDTHIIVALMDSTLNGFNDKGRRLWRKDIGDPITCVERIQLKNKNLDMAGVACRDTVHIYSTTGELLDKVKCMENISSIYFGQYGRESNSLAVITAGGSLHLKILKRSADFTPQISSEAKGVSGKLQIPKKTKLFVDQTMRERENSIAMHRTFQKFLFHAKLDTARQLVNVIAKKQTPTTINDTVKISAQVLGLGPSFRLQIGIYNLSSEALVGLGLFFQWDDKFYQVEPPYIRVPMLVPSAELKFVAKAECVTTDGIADVVKVVVIKDSQVLLVAIINMPPSELTLFD